MFWGGTPALVRTHRADVSATTAEPHELIEMATGVRWHVACVGRICGRRGGVWASGRRARGTRSVCAGAAERYGRVGGADRVISGCASRANSGRRDLSGSGRGRRRVRKIPLQPIGRSVGAGSAGSGLGPFGDGAAAISQRAGRYGTEHRVDIRAGRCVRESAERRDDGDPADAGKSICGGKSKNGATDQGSEGESGHYRDSTGESAGRVCAGVQPDGGLRSASSGTGI